MYYKFSLTFCFLVALFSCVPPTDVELTEVDIDSQNKQVKNIIRLQNLGKIDSLVPFFKNPDPTLRFLSVNAFASNNVPKYIDSIAILLDDSNMNVRATAAYALGQTREARAINPLVGAFKDVDTISVNTILNANILEAIGKCGNSNMLDHISNIETYRDTDTLLLLGQMRGLYRFALRGMTTAQSIATAVKYASKPELDTRVRLVAAHKLARAKNIDIEDHKTNIIEAIKTESNVNVKMALYSSLRHTSDAKTLEFLMSKLDTESDYRVKINIIKALGSYSYINVVDKIIEYLKNDNPHVSVTAAQYLINHGNGNDATFYREFAQQAKHWNTKAELYRSVMKNLPHYYTQSNTAIRKEIFDQVNGTENPNEKVAYIRSLSEDVNAYKDLVAYMKSTDNEVLKSACAEAIGSILTSDKFNLIHKTRANSQRRAVIRDMEEIFSANQQGTVYYLSEAIANPESKLAALIKNTAFLNKTKNNLKLPADVETYNAIVKALKTCRPDSSVNAIVPEPSLAIDYTLKQQYPDSTIAIIKTDKGIIKLQFFPELAPLSVYNFLKLTNENFYDNKVFHRVVPNFVAQAGCPTGDGFGSADYTIRSEFSQAYYDQSGYVGMASAGPHTESTQWFITHSPTPHLDGKYTIFAKVFEGMDVVHKLEPGEKIIDVILSTL
jgi:cyclophilin family peptidyl-prolyl cis-trans isomerase/HEAT repeat protein